MKNYATQTDIITTPDAIYAPGAVVKYGHTLYAVWSFSWDDWNKTWTYCLAPGGNPVGMNGMVIEELQAVPESELSTV